MIETPLTTILKEAARQSLRINVPNLFWQLFAEAIDEPENPGRDATYLDDLGTEGNVVLVTGGLDSTILYHRAKKQTDKLTGLYLDFGQPYAKKEQAVLEKLDIPYIYHEVDMGYSAEESGWKHIIPARNFIAIDMAAHLAGVDGVVWFGVTHGESRNRGGDKSRWFIGNLQALLYQLYGTARIETLLDGTKTENVAHFLEDGGDPEVILSTFSCFNGEGEKQCGRCQSCLRHYIALVNNELPMHLILDHYEINPMDGCTESIEKYRHLMGAELRGELPEYYGRRRIVQDLAVIAPDILARVGL